MITKLTMMFMLAMLRIVRRLPGAGMVAFIVALVMGCGGPSLPVNYYVLTPMDETAVAAGPVQSQSLALGIGPVNLPAYLDRIQLVTRVGPNGVKVDDFHRWAAPLKEEISRVVGENLKQLTGIQRQETYPWAFNRRPSVSVALEFHTFEGQFADQVILDATVVLSDYRGAEPQIRYRDFRIVQSAASANPGDQVAAQNFALSELCRQISKDILALVGR